MHQRLNRDRKEAGLPPLEYDTRLADIARYHSADMRDHRFFEHDSPTSGSLQDRLNAAGYIFVAARENLSEAPDVQQGQDGLLRSPPHHANIMAEDITHVGIGVVAGGVHATENLTITQVFARPARSETAAEARDTMLEAIARARSREGLPAARRSPLLVELAEKHIATLAADEGQLSRISDLVSEEVSKRREPGQRGVLVGTQRLAESSALQLPSALLKNANVSFGLAVQPTKDATGRPQLQVLILVGI